MRIIILLTVASMVLSVAAQDVLVGPEHGKIVLQDGEYKFLSDEKRNKKRAAQSGLDTFKQWHVIGAKLQAPVPHRPAERVLTGGVGHFNIGMLGPYSGIPIFMAVGGEQPRLVAITDGNGRFAIRFEGGAQGKDLYLFFSGEIDTVRRQADDTRVEILGLPRVGNIRVADGRTVLALNSLTERYRVTLPAKAEQD